MVFNMMMALCTILGAGDKVMKDRPLSTEMLWPWGRTGTQNRCMCVVAVP